MDIILKLMKFFRLILYRKRPLKRYFNQFRSRTGTLNRPPLTVESIQWKAMGVSIDNLNINVIFASFPHHIGYEAI